MEKLYSEWVDRFAPVQAWWTSTDRWAEGDTEATEARAFADWVSAVTAWRRLPYLDPGLPLESLPSDWMGLRAEALVTQLREFLSPPARRHVTRVLGP